VRGVKDVALSMTPCSAPPTARKLERNTRQSSGTYPRPGMLRRKRRRNRDPRSVSLFEAVTRRRREGVKLQRYKGSAR